VEVGQGRWVKVEAGRGRRLTVEAPGSLEAGRGHRLAVKAGRGRWRLVRRMHQARPVRQVSDEDGEASEADKALDLWAAVVRRPPGGSGTATWAAATAAVPRAQWNENLATV
jgi:hypothetical protein